MNKIKLLVVCAWLCLFVGCGGGGGNPGKSGPDTADSGGGNGSGGNTPGTNGSNGSSGSASTAADFLFSFDKRFISNSGSDSAKLTVTALDANNNVVAGIPIAVKVDNATFSQTAKVTDDKGKYSGVIEIGQDKSNRVVKVTMTMGEVSKQTSITVNGTVITANLIPANPRPGEAVRLELSVKDSLANRIPDASVTLSGDLIPEQKLTANGAEPITLSFTAPSSPKTYTLRVDGLGATFSREVQVGNSQTIPRAAAAISSASLSVAPTVLSPNPIGSSENRTQLKAKFLDASRAGIPNVRVQFRITSAENAGGRISVGDGVVYSDAAGEATADFIPGSISSANEGVEIKACYKTSDLSSSDLENNCANLQTSSDGGITEGQTLTVAAEPVSIAISDYSKLEKGPSGIDYLAKLLIQVTNAAGQGVADAVVSANLNITHFGKGLYARDYSGESRPPAANYTGDNSLTPGTTQRVWCTNEDLNRNAALDAGEDRNGNGILEPEQAAVSFSYVDGKNKTDANGQMFIKVSYGQKYATWLAYTVKVTTKVKNSEGSTSMRFITAFTEDDKDKGTFHTPPYGTGRCDAAD